MQRMRDIKYIFLSYSSENVVEADALRDIFELSGVKVWMANHAIGAGDDFSTSIHKAIEDCSCFVLLLTEEAQASPWVPKELDLAISQRKPIVPVTINTVELSQAFKFSLINTQIVNLPRIDIKNADTQRLISAVKEYIKGRKQTVLHHSTATPSSQANARSRKGIALIFIPFILVFLFIAIIVVSVFSQVLPNLFGGNGLPNYSDIINGQALPSPDASEINQIPNDLVNTVTTLKHADDLTVRNRTKVIKVGEYTSLSTVWNDAVIYSEDTRIAIGEGTLVKGVSPGTTYVIIATSKQVNQTFKIIVEE